MTVAIARRLTVAPLAPAIGSEISGVDLSQPLSDDLLAQTRTALWARQVIFFRGQRLSPAQHLAFAHRAGQEARTHRAHASRTAAQLFKGQEAIPCTYRIAFGPRSGQKVLTVLGAMPRQTEFKQTLCADINGLSLHAAVGCAADDRQALEQLCRTITWPALADERVQLNDAGQVELKIIAAILERAVIEKILAHLGLDPQPPPKGRVREAGPHVAA